MYVSAELKDLRGELPDGTIAEVSAEDVRGIPLSAALAKAMLLDPNAPVVPPPPIIVSDDDDDDEPALPQDNLAATRAVTTPDDGDPKASASKLGDKTGVSNPVSKATDEIIDLTDDTAMATSPSAAESSDSKSQEKGITNAQNQHKAPKRGHESIEAGEDGVGSPKNGQNEGSEGEERAAKRARHGHESLELNEEGASNPNEVPEEGLEEGRGEVQRVESRYEGHMRRYAFQ